ncbi:hypothetical protein A2U01_0070500 [Trifolium medium]|uniref:Uncharacterized protein n=1 Tax=Trifolium medium TaxID=97028 RepID=A0A392SMZ6_9FABA|nr:hypothetical protein [Trifolium medium]
MKSHRGTIGFVCFEQICAAFPNSPDIVPRCLSSWHDRILSQEVDYRLRIVPRWSFIVAR